ncbi:MAG TPA: cyclic nucleotide-binding domain-containing protein [Treponemataceae bacterium]|jgi:CRP-like cAMP-binding protein|nr:cyclic nucleotide-binding domain-containing protein [Treponemataceae bacterium]HQL33379.1 cyclic nucleotide-binding domain-containing protein [Treponemataceae bacterium]
MKKVDIFPEALFSSLIDIPMFSQIDPSDLGDLPGICDLFSFEPGERIIKEGEMSSSLFTLLSGEVEILKKGHQKEDIVINSLTNGTVFGETSLFKNQPSTATVRAKSLSLIMALSRERFSAYINSHPKAGLVIMTYIVYGLLEKLRSSNEVIAFDKEFMVSSSDLDAMKTLLPPTMEEILS